MCESTRSARADERGRKKTKGEEALGPILVLQTPPHSAAPSNERGGGHALVVASTVIYQKQVIGWRPFIPRTQSRERWTGPRRERRGSVENWRKDKRPAPLSLLLCRLFLAPLGQFGIQKGTVAAVASRRGQ